MSDERKQAVERVEKLRRITVANGAAPAEEENAKARIVDIIEKYKLNERPPTPPPSQQTKSPFSSVYVKPDLGIELEELRKHWKEEEPQFREDDFVQWDNAYPTYDAKTRVATYWVNDKEFKNEAEAKDYLRKNSWRRNREY